MDLLIPYLVWSGLLICLFTIVFGIFPGKTSEFETVEVKRQTSVALGVLLFFSVERWLQLILYIVAGRVFKQHETQSILISFSLSVLFSLFFALRIGRRLALGKATKRYLRENFLAAVVLILMWLASSICIHLEKIDGDTPEAAAESVLARHAELLPLEVSLVEVNPAPDCDIKVFNVMSESESCGMIDVQRYLKYWQARELYPISPTSAMLLRLAKERLKDPERRRQAIIDLRKIVMRYPSTPEAAEAQTLLKAFNTPILEDD